MAEDNPARAGASTPPAATRACDLCRGRKIRCERTFPCSNCQRIGVECKISRRKPREKRKRILMTTEYEEKIDHIDKTLARLGCSVEKLQGGGSMSPRTAAVTTPPQAHLSSAVPSTSCTTSQDASLRAAAAIEPDTRPTINAKDVAESEVLIEGQSSFTAHCEFAIGFLHNVVGSRQPAMDDGSEITALLDTLHHILDAFHLQRLSPNLLFPLAKSVSSSGSNGHQMPPLESVFAVIYKAQEENNFTYLSLSHILSPRSLSDLFLKIYFSGNHSNAEFIIVNAALLFLHGDSGILSNSENGNEEFQLMCRTNLETALSGLSLYIQTSYDLILALVLGAIYAIDNSNPPLAWTLVNTAAQSAHTLGLHARAGWANFPPDQQNQRLVLFWAVYFLEKTLCLRLGRSSTIRDCDITVPWPGDLQVAGSHALEYFHHQVKVAGLAGSIYEQLYSGNALHLPGETRTTRALELVELLDRHGGGAREATEMWNRSTTDKHVKQQLRFISATDEVAHLSMLTLVHRAALTARDAATTFNPDCISCARAALERHCEFVAELGTEGLPLVSVHIQWYCTLSATARTILFTPFFPFIVLFCHVIETGDLEDLKRMETFAMSMKDSCQNSGTIAKHHRLFQVFYSVAARYTELTMHSSPMQAEQRKLKSQVDAQLSALGLQPNGSYMGGHSNMTTTLETGPESGPMASSESAAGLNMEFTALDQHGQPRPHRQPSTTQEWEQAQQGLLLGNWFSFNQQMMGLMDQGDFPF